MEEKIATMANNWLSELTGAAKPIIGMAHLPALPGTPLYDAAGGMRHIRDWVSRDLEALQQGGISAVMFCNENDRPYRLALPREEALTFIQSQSGKHFDPRVVAAFITLV